MLKTIEIRGLITDPVDGSFRDESVEYVFSSQAIVSFLTGVNRWHNIGKLTIKKGFLKGTSDYYNDKSDRMDGYSSTMGGRISIVHLLATNFDISVTPDGNGDTLRTLLGDEFIATIEKLKEEGYDHITWVRPNL